MRWRKLRKLTRSPGVFLRDWLVARYPRVLNEVGCPEQLEAALIEHALDRERALEPGFPIDVVYTWVDGSDPAWYERYLAQTRTPAIAGPLRGAGTDAARFHAHDELTWSIRSVLAYMPWVRRIIVVTDRQRPPGLEGLARVEVVDHRDLIDATWLPTFNSHVIEAHLHRIAGLAEHFIYFNDDVLVGRPLPPGHFFQPNGLASLFLSNKSLAASRAAGLATPTQLASIHSAALLASQHGACVDRPLVHTYVPLRRSAYEAVWAQHEARIEAFLSNRTRAGNDLNLATLLVPWHAFLTGQASIATDICHYFNIRSPAALPRYEVLLSRQRSRCAPHSMCLNDFMADPAEGLDFEPRMQSFLRSYYADLALQPTDPVLLKEPA